MRMFLLKMAGYLHNCHNWVSPRKLKTGRCCKYLIRSGCICGKRNRLTVSDWRSFVTSSTLLYDRLFSVCLSSCSPAVQFPFFTLIRYWSKPASTTTSLSEANMSSSNLFQMGSNRNSAPHSNVQITQGIVCFVSRHHSLCKLRSPFNVMRGLFMLQNFLRDDTDSLHLKADVVWNSTLTLHILNCNRQLSPLFQMSRILNSNKSCIPLLFWFFLPFVFVKPHSLTCLMFFSVSRL